MKKITIITPANIEVEYRLAGVGSRLSAFLIDYTIQLLATGLAALIILLGIDRHVMGNLLPSGMALGAVLLAYFIIHFGYFILCEMLMNGRTVGKRILALRAIRENGQPMAFHHVLIRAIFRTSIDMLYVGFFAILFSKQHKRLGNMAAGTVVVGEHPIGAGEFDFAPWRTRELPGFAAQYAHTPLTAEEQRVLDEWMRRKDSLPDGGWALEGLLREYFAGKHKPIEEGDDDGNSSIDASVVG